MSYFELLLAGIGTAAGVAWPLYSLVAALFNFSVGGIASIAFGIGCTLIFLTVSLCLIYIKYQSYQFQENQAKNNAQGPLPQCLAQLVLLLQQEYKKQNNLDSNLDNFIFRKLSLLKKPYKKKTLVLEDFLQFVEEKGIHWSQVLKEGQLHNVETIIKSLLEDYFNQRKSIFSSKKNRLHLLETALPSFFGTFGSIAGCSCGIGGLLVGLGVFAGLNTVPTIAAIILTFALCSAIYMTLESVKLSEKKKQAQLYLGEVEQLDKETNKLVHKIHKQEKNRIAQNKIEKKETKLEYLELSPILTGQGSPPPTFFRRATQSEEDLINLDSDPPLSSISPH